MKNFTKEEIEQIRTDYLNGMKLFELSNKYKRNNCSIIGLLERIGIYKKVNNRWSEHEIELLREVYPICSKEEILKYFPNRTINNIYGKASKLGLTKDFKHWSKHDVDILLSYYGIYDINKIKGMLEKNYSTISIKSKAAKLGVSCIKRWNDEENKILKDNYHKIPIDDIAKLLPGRSHDSIRTHAKTLGLISHYTILNNYSQEQLDFIRLNWETMSDSNMASELGKCSSGIMEQRHKMGLYRLNKEYTGYEDFSKLLRGQIGSWKNMSMKNCDHKCVITGSKDYEIHHIYGFNLILKELYEKLSKENILHSNNINEYDKSELDFIINEFLKIHNKYPLGVCIRKDIHELFHSIYGTGGNNEYQWNEFIQNYKKGIYL